MDMSEQAPTLPVLRAAGPNTKGTAEELPIYVYARPLLGEVWLLGRHEYVTLSRTDGARASGSAG